LYTDANNVVARGGEREGNERVGGADWADHGADSWAWPDSGAHPDVLAAIVAIRAGLRALLRERKADATPPPRALRLAAVAPHDSDGIDETVRR